jgi:hypothetical protein
MSVSLPVLFKSLPFHLSIFQQLYQLEFAHPLFLFYQFTMGALDTYRGIVPVALGSFQGPVRFVHLHT